LTDKFTMYKLMYFRKFSYNFNANLFKMYSKFVLGV